MTDSLTCPSCSEPSILAAIDRGGVVVDACPRCRGVWLDRGELDKLIELEASPNEDFLAEIRGGSSGREPDSRESGGQHGSGKHGSKTGAYGRKKKRGGMLGEFFDLG